MNRIKWMAIGMALMSILLIIIFGATRFIFGDGAIDSCLDKGCSWDYQKKECDCVNSHPGPLALEQNLTQIENEPKHTFKPKGGYVANAKIAIQIAETILKSIYGIKKIDEEKPLTAIFKNGV